MVCQFPLQTVSFIDGPLGVGLLCLGFNGGILTQDYLIIKGLILSVLKIAIPDTLTQTIPIHVSSLDSES